MKAPVFTNKSSALRQLLFSVAVVLFAVSAKPARALEGLYIGGQVGNVALGSPISRSSLGFGGDLGFKTTSQVDLVVSLLHASFTGSTSLLAPFLSAELHAGHAYDFDFTIGAGPGFYNFSVGPFSETKFGLQFGGAVDFVLDDHFRVGLGTRYHVPFGSSTVSSNIWTVTMRAGYLFTME